MQATHLIVLLHGLYGDVHNLHAVKSELLALADPEASTISDNGASGAEKHNKHISNERPKKSLETVVYLPKSIKGAHTWDGIDVCAHRVAEELDHEIERLQDESKDIVGFSVMGYSLGGLIGRYLVGLLHARQPSFFARHRPVSFSTAATPHLGVLKYGTKTNTFVHSIGRRLFSHTGMQLYCMDHETEWGGRNLLEVMADPDGVFISGLRLFPKSMLIANGTRDLTVPYPTASISPIDPFDDSTYLDIEIDENNIVQSYRRISLEDKTFSKFGSISTSTTQRMQKDEEEVEVLVTTLHKKPGRIMKVKKRSPPPFPPVLILPLRWPFNYSLLLFIPVLLPLFLLYITIMITWITFHSRRRVQSLRHEIKRQPLLSSSPSLPSTPNSSLSDTAYSARQTILEPIKALQDGTCTPPMADPLLTGSAPQPLLTSHQKMMVKTLNEAMPNAKRVIAWFPWAYNAHAMLICRSVARFPWQKDGLGVVKTWAKFAFEAGEAECHAKGTEAVAHGNT
ncbi:lipid particle protein [Cryptococcus gattii Ru294]|nr:lipid particle protein [Cryptococcus gattii Ru294]